MVSSNQAAAHESPTRLARDDDSIRDLGRQAGRPARRGAVATRQALNPIRLPFPELLHVVEFTFFQEVDCSARVLQNI